mmetsp:Transcript_20839/g.31063  ORF Transcript_20839/g.31063 Transcript_20839/m.31063 type:complete len:237 (-) Transcript_20839:975-1685(-)
MLREKGVVLENLVVPLSAGIQERAKSLVGNPYASALFFKKLVHAVFSIVVGCPPNIEIDLSGKDRDATRKSHHYDERKKGIFGTILAHISVNENQARGTFHIHTLIYGGLSPRLLQLGAHEQSICKAIAEVLDEMFCCSMDRKQHIRYLLKQQLNWMKVRWPRSLIDLHPSLIVPHNFEEVKRLGLCTCRHTNVHRHAFTCYSGLRGKQSCRMCYKMGLIDSTRPVQLMVESEEES